MVSKFSLIFVNFVLKDFAVHWPNQFTDLISLMSQQDADDKYRLQVVDFILQIFEIFNADIIERGEHMTNDDVMKANEVKEVMRSHAIEPITDFFIQTILANFKSLKTETVERSLHILAQLIDWNELKFFVALVKDFCQPILNDPNTSQKLKNGAFNCVQACVSKGMRDHSEKIGNIL